MVERNERSTRVDAFRAETILAMGSYLVVPQARQGYRDVTRYPVCISRQ